MTARLELFYAIGLPGSGWFIAPGPVGRPLRDALAERVSPYYRHQSTARVALAEKRREYEAETADERAARREVIAEAERAHRARNRCDQVAPEQGLPSESREREAEAQALAEREPYLCTVAIRMPADDGLSSLRPEDVTEWLNEQGARMIEWHNEDLLGAGERERARAEEAQAIERRDAARRLLEYGAEVLRLSQALAGLPDSKRGRLEVISQELGLAASEVGS